jgi:tRNA threonylcarbamoyl adenosine modification protein YeaZ
LSGVASGPLLAIDSGSPRVSVAVGGAGGVLAEACVDREHSSTALLALIDGVLGQAGLRGEDLAGVVALQGPGSFTGLRVGLATALGLHQALGLPAVGVPTLEILAALGPGDGSTVTAVVDALRGDWFGQAFRSEDPPQALAPPELRPASALRRLRSGLLVGFGASAIAGSTGATVRILEPPPLAAVAVRQLARHPIAWDPASLVAPLYLRPPSARPSP